MDKTSAARRCWYKSLWHHIIPNWNLWRFLESVQELKVICWSNELEETTCLFLTCETIKSFNVTKHTPLSCDHLPRCWCHEIYVNRACGTRVKTKKLSSTVKDRKSKSVGWEYQPFIIIYTWLLTRTQLATGI